MEKIRALGFHKLFLLIAVPIGALYLLIAPLLSGNDDINHLRRIYEISQGNMVSMVTDEGVGRDLPEGFKELNEPERNYSNVEKALKLDTSGEKEFMVFPNTALYSPISYIPQVMGAWLGNLFSGGSLFWIVTMARVFNFIVYVTLCYFGMKMVPRFKLFFLILLASPSIMSNATSLSADAFVVGLVFLLISAVVCINEEKKVVGLKTMLGLSAIAVLIAGCKIAYLPCVLVVLLINHERFKNRTAEILFKVLCLVAAGLVGLIWLKFAGQMLAVAYPMASEQMRYIFSNPPQFLLAIVRTMMGSGVQWLYNLYSSAPMYQNMVSMNIVVRIGFLAVAALAIFNEDKKSVSSSWQRVFLGLIALAVAGTIFVALYTQWTPQHCGDMIGCATVKGVQGRYFIPMVIMLIMTIGKPKFKLERRWILVGFLVLHLFSLITIATVFVG